MRQGLACVLCAACCAAAGAWGWDGRLPVSGTQDIASLLPVPKADWAAMFSAADVNHDERLTFEEAHNYSFLVTQPMFDTYDTDHNGYIDRAEAGLPPVDINIGQIFEAADVNNDEQLTFEEAYACNAQVTRAQFDTYDVNHDGCIDRAEAGLPPADKNGCEGCSGGKSWPASGDLFTMALSLLGLAAMAKVGRP